MSASLALMLALVSANPSEQAPLWLTFDVLNPDEAGGHRILHLEDMLGTRASTVPDLPRARAILLFTALIADCNPTTGVCAEVGKLAADARKKGGQVICVLLDPRETVARTWKDAAPPHHPFILTTDTHGLTRHALGLDRPAELIVINSQGRFVRFTQPSETAGELKRKVEEAKRAFMQALERDKEDEQ